MSAPLRGTYSVWWNKKRQGRSQSGVFLLFADGRELALASSLDTEQPTAVGGYELVVGGDVDGAGGKVLGHRQFARYYRQKYRAGDARHSIAINRVLAQCAPASPCKCMPHSAVLHVVMQIAVLLLVGSSAWLCLTDLASTGTYVVREDTMRGKDCTQE